MKKFFLIMLALAILNSINPMINNDMSEEVLEKMSLKEIPLEKIPSSEVFKKLSKSPVVALKKLGENKNFIKALLESEENVSNSFLREIIKTLVRSVWSYSGSVEDFLIKIINSFYRLKKPENMTKRDIHDYIWFKEKIFSFQGEVGFEEIMNELKSHDHFEMYKNSYLIEKNNLNLRKLFELSDRDKILNIINNYLDTQIKRAEEEMIEYDLKKIKFFYIIPVLSFESNIYRPTEQSKVQKGSQFFVQAGILKEVLDELPIRHEKFNDHNKTYMEYLDNKFRNINNLKRMKKSFENGIKYLKIEEKIRKKEKIEDEEKYSQEYLIAIINNEKPAEWAKKLDKETINKKIKEKNDYFKLCKGVACYYMNTLAEIFEFNIDKKIELEKLQKLYELISEQYEKIFYSIKNKEGGYSFNQNIISVIKNIFFITENQIKIVRQFKEYILFLDSILFSDMNTFDECQYGALIDELFKEKTEKEQLNFKNINLFFKDFLDIEENRSRRIESLFNFPGIDSLIMKLINSENDNLYLFLNRERNNINGRFKEMGFELLDELNTLDINDNNLMKKYLEKILLGGEGDLSYIFFKALFNHINLLSPDKNYYKLLNESLNDLGKKDIFNKNNLNLFLMAFFEDKKRTEDFFLHMDSSNYSFFVKICNVFFDEAPEKVPHNLRLKISDIYKKNLDSTDSTDIYKFFIAQIGQTRLKNLFG